MDAMKFPKLKLSSKVLLFYLIVSLVPLIVVSFVLVSSAHTQFLNAASTKQQIVVANLAEKVDDYLGNKMNSLSFQAKVYTVNNFTSLQVNRNLALLIAQNQDINEVFMLDAKGLEQNGFNRQGQVRNFADRDQSKSDAYKAVSYFGKPYISSVSYDESKPYITIAVPILRSDSPAAKNNLSPSNIEIFNQPDALKSVLVANFDISDLWKTVLSTEIGRGGYAYVVDANGNLVAHPDDNFLLNHKKIDYVQAVQQYRSGNLETSETKSETGLSVISSPKTLSRIGWAVIVEEPVSSIYADTNSFIRLSAIVGISAIILCIFMAFFFSRQLTGPIKKLSEGAKKLGAGMLDEVINIKSNDELADLANTFNSMGRNIKKLVNDLTTNNSQLTIEKTKLSRIIDNVSDGIVALNNQGQIVSINPPASSLIHQTPQALIGRKMVDTYLWEQDGKPLHIEITKPGLYHFSDVVLVAGSKTLYLDLVIYVMEHTVADDMKVIITIHDLTKSRELDFMKLDFVAIAGHELRTPLTVVQGYLDILKKEAIQQLSIFNVENLQKAISGTEQLRSLINKLLNIARIERGDMEIFIEKLDLTKMVKENVKQHSTPAAQKLQRLKFSANTEGKVYVPADPASIVEVLNNLIGNAIKYTPEKGEIQVNLVAGPETVRVEVKDNGPGIPTELRKKLFTKFFRAERSLIAGTRGTGLGLFISKTILELQSGAIGLEPDDGHGSTFYFTLPAYEPNKHDNLVANNKKIGGINGWFKKRANH